MNRLFLSLTAKEIELIAGRKDDMLKKYPKREEDIKYFIQHDPTPQKNLKYLEWEMKVLEAGQYEKEDIIHVVEQFDKFNSKLDKKDINQYKPEEFITLRDMLAEIAHEVIKTKDVKDESLKKLERDYAEAGSEVIYKSDKFIIRLMKNKIASCHFGAGYPWCISNKNQTMWEQYEAENRIFFVCIPQFEAGKENDRIVIAVFRDVNNRAEDIRYWNRINKGSGDPEAKAFIQKHATKGEFAKIEAAVQSSAEAQPKGILAKLHDNSVSGKEIEEYYKNIFKNQAPLPQNATEEDRQVRRQNDSYIETEIVRSKKTPKSIKKTLALDGNVEAILQLKGSLKEAKIKIYKYKDIKKGDTVLVQDENWDGPMKVVDFEIYEPSNDPLNPDYYKENEYVILRDEVDGIVKVPASSIKKIIKKEAEGAELEQALSNKEKLILDELLENNNIDPRTLAERYSLTLPEVANALDNLVEKEFVHKDKVIVKGFPFPVTKYQVIKYAGKKVLFQIKSLPIELVNSDTGKTEIIPGGHIYNVIGEGEKFWVTDEFHKPGVPQIISKEWSEKIEKEAEAIKKVVKVKTDDDGRVYTNKESIKEFLTGPQEMTVFFEDGSTGLLTDLEGKKVLVNDEEILVQEKEASLEYEWGVISYDILRLGLEDGSHMDIPSKEVEQKTRIRMVDYVRGHPQAVLEALQKTVDPKVVSWRMEESDPSKRMKKVFCDNVTEKKIESIIYRWLENPSTKIEEIMKKYKNEFDEIKKDLQDINEVEIDDDKLNTFIELKLGKMGYVVSDSYGLLTNKEEKLRWDDSDKFKKIMKERKIDKRRLPKLAEAYTWQDQEQQFKQVPFEDGGNDIGVSHTFSNNSGDFIHESLPGMFKFMDPQAVTPQTASPASFIAVPMEAALEKEAVDPDGKMNERDVIDSLKAQGLDIRDIKPAFALEGFDKNKAPGVLNLFNQESLKFEVKRDGGDIKIEGDDVSNSLKNGLLKKYPMLYPYIYSILTEKGKEIMDTGKLEPEKKEETVKEKKEETPEAKLEQVLDKIEGFRYKPKDIKGTIYSYAILPEEEFRKSTESYNLDYDKLYKQKSGVTGKYLWKFLPKNRIMVIK